MTNDELAKIREQAEKATPGPWKDDGDHRILAPAVGAAVVNAEGNGYGGVTFPEDMAFIVASRADVPALLAEVERLRAREAAWREIGQAVAAWGDEHGEEWLTPNDCPHCNLPARDDKDWPIVEHLPDCPVVKARALLANEGDRTR